MIRLPPTKQPSAYGFHCPEIALANRIHKTVQHEDPYLYCLSQISETVDRKCAS